LAPLSRLSCALRASRPSRRQQNLSHRAPAAATGENGTNMTDGTDVSGSYLGASQDSRYTTFRAVGVNERAGGVEREALLAVHR
jgi:hypothetical protein